VFLNTGDAVETADEVTSIVSENKGWFLNFVNNRARNVGSASMHLSSLLFTAFTPSSDICSDDVGNTRLYQREFFNGLSPAYSAAIDKDKKLGAGEDVEYAIPDTINLGDNYYREPTDDGLTQSNEGELKKIDLGNPNLPNRRESWREINKDW
jgi:type IV pilus assembly protein PilY1